MKPLVLTCLLAMFSIHAFAQSAPTPQNAVAPGVMFDIARLLRDMVRLVLLGK